jgi:hypothetical protein
MLSTNLDLIKAVTTVTARAAHPHQHLNMTMHAQHEVSRHPRSREYAASYLHAPFSTILRAVGLYTSLKSKRFISEISDRTNWHAASTKQIQILLVLSPVCLAALPSSQLAQASGRGCQ